MLHEVSQGDQGLVESSTREEFIQHDKITVKMSWLFFVRILESQCDTENCEYFDNFKTL